MEWILHLAAVWEKSSKKQLTRTCSGNWCDCEKKPPLGLDCLYHMLRLVFHCSWGKGTPAGEGGGNPLSTKEGRQSYHQFRPQLPHRTKLAVVPVCFRTS